MIPGESTTAKPEPLRFVLRDRVDTSRCLFFLPDRAVEGPYDPAAEDPPQPAAQPAPWLPRGPR